jgi:hypothetical protein
VIPRGRITTRLVFDRVELEVKRSGEKGEEIRFDSREPKKEEGAKEAGMLARALAPLHHLAGGAVEPTQFPSGLIERFEGVDALKAKLLKDGPDDPLYKRGCEGIAHHVFLDNLLKPAIVMPQEGFSKGVVLQFQDLRLLPVTAGVPGYLYAKGTYHLAEAKDGLARVEMSGDCSLDPFERMPPWPKSAQAGRARLRLQKGTCKAWATVRVETGVLEESEHVTDLDLVFLRPDGKGEIPIPVKVTLKVKRIP